MKIQALTSKLFAAMAKAWAYIVIITVAATQVSAQQPGNAQSFNGVNQYDSIYIFRDGNAIAYEYTVEVWVKPNVTTGTMEIFSTRGATAAADYSFEMALVNGTTVHAQIGDGTSWLVKTADAPLAYKANQWHHIAYTVSFFLYKEYRIYIDGSLAVKGHLNGGPVVLFDNAHRNGYVGANAPFKSSYFNGSIDELRFYSGILSQAEVQATMLGKPIARPARDYYNFNQSTGNILQDTALTFIGGGSNGGWNGVLVNNPGWVESYAMVAPVATAATASASAFMANWAAPANATVSNYFLDAATSPDFNAASILPGYNGKLVTGTSAVVNVGPSPTPILYYYRVRAFKNAQAGESINSNTITVLVQPLPAISSFAPSAAAAGDTITITGSNFANTPGNNIVYFGAVKAAVITASPTVLKAVVPPGATYSPLSVAVNGFICYSAKPFILTFRGGQQPFTNRSFAPPSVLATYNNQTTTLADLDGDGNPDLLISSAYSGQPFEARRNISTIGNIAFGPAISYAGPTSQLAVADFNGDGKLDVAGLTTFGFITYKNISTTGNISLEKAAEFIGESATIRSIAVGDINQDGLPDIAVLKETEILLFKNTSSGGNISFSLEQRYPVPNLYHSPLRKCPTLIIADLDGDNKPDIAAITSIRKCVLFKNTTTAGVISFGAPVESVSLPPLNSYYLTQGDFDGDGKLDLAVAGDYTGTAVEILKNTSSPDNLSFSLNTQVKYTGYVGASTISVGDVNGDGRVDIWGGFNKSIHGGFMLFINTGADGNNIVQFTGQQLGSQEISPLGSAIGDIDGDGLPDLIGLQNHTQVLIYGNRWQVNKWAGNVSSDWNTAANWEGNTVPKPFQNIAIPAGTRYQPVITSPKIVQDVANAATITVNNNTSLTITGNISDSGTINAPGSLVFAGTEAQVISNKITVKNITVNNASGVAIVNGSVRVLGTYTPEAGVLHVIGNLTLASTAEGTANVAAGPFFYIRGNVTVERYIPARRAWRLLTTPVVNTGSVFNNWQNNGNIIEGAGAVFFSPSGTGDGIIKGGFAASLQKYNVQTNQWDKVFSTVLERLGDRTATTPTNSFKVFVTGPYGSNTIDSGAIATTLRATGSLLSGPLKFSINAPARHMMAIGNPYASPVGLDSIAKYAANTTGSYWVWDASRRGTSDGGYVIFSYDPITQTFDQDIEPLETAATPVIQSGEAFMVQADSGNVATQVFFEERFKKDAKASSNGVFFAPTGGTPAPELHIILSHLYKTRGYPEDAALVKFNDLYSKGEGDDADKLFDDDENLSLRVDTALVGIERRPVPVAGDTIYIDISPLKLRTNYQLTFNPENLSLPGIQAYLKDIYLNSITEISLNSLTNISFATNGDSASLARGRFIILFVKQGALASVITNVKAWQQSTGVQVQWATATEQGIQQYQAEKSTDGLVFNALGIAINPRNTGRTETYDITDDHPSTGNNYYRVKVTSKDGSTAYSSIVIINLVNGKSGIQAYPNPVQHGSKITLRVNNMAAGKYSLVLYTADGRAVLQKQLQYNMLIATQTISLPFQVAAGSYRLVMADENGNKWWQNVVVQ